MGEIIKKETAYKFDSIKRKIYIEKILEGLNRGEAAQAVGMHRSQIYNYFSTHPEFKEEVSKAEIKAVEDQLIAHTKKSVPACIYFLVNRCPERWQNNHHQQVLIIPPISDAELKRQLKELDIIK